MIEPAASPWKRSLHRIIFETRTPGGRAFDVLLLLAILASVSVVMLDSVDAVGLRHGRLLRRIEWGFTLLFTAEYLLRLSIVARPRRYAGSFFGLVDLLAILPSYASLLVPGAQALLVIRLVRIVRVFQVFDMPRAVGAGQLLLVALRSARNPLLIFLLALSILVVFLGALMYLVEGAGAGFTSIPMGVYWAVVTLTTLGYGDLVPQTALGQGLTTGIVVLGYWVLAVPVGLISMAIANAARREGGAAGSPPCPGCGRGGHAADAAYCRACGEALVPDPPGGDAPSPMGVPIK